jgi:hypothetical protein
MTQRTVLPPELRLATSHAGWDRGTAVVVSSEDYNL